MFGNTDFERGVSDGRVDRRAGTTYVGGGSEYERGYQAGYSQMCDNALGRTSFMQQGILTQQYQWFPNSSSNAPQQ